MLTKMLAEAEVNRRRQQNQEQTEIQPQQSIQAQRGTQAQEIGLQEVPVLNF